MHGKNIHCKKHTCYNRLIPLFLWIQPSLILSPVLVPKKQAIANLKTATLCIKISGLSLVEQNKDGHDAVCILPRILESSQLAGHI